MCHLHEQGKRHFFVIAPKSVVINWEREVIKHTKLVPLIIHGSNRQSVLEQWKRSGGVGITTYGTIGALAEDLGAVDMVAVDEAHLIKNRRAKRTAAVGGVIEKAEFVALMSGTALENRLSELHALVTLVQPGIKSRVDYLIDSDFPHPEEARRRVAPVYLRRKQQDYCGRTPFRSCAKVRPNESALGDDDRREQRILRKVRKAQGVAGSV
ncbi:MAG: SNF2-related protein, partial [Verrucomicrobia bacterium]|nr:SNF2-related protein [Verrucomicrobiota bacterium]